MTSWMLESNDILDALIDEQINQYGYNDRSEFVREAIRDFIIQRNIKKLGLNDLEKNREKAKNVDPKFALEMLQNIQIDRKELDNIVLEEQEKLEKALLKFSGEMTD